MTNNEKTNVEFKNGKLFVQEKLFTGKKTFTFMDGDVYEGEFSDGLRHGQGIFRLTNGDAYEGEFKNGDAFGHGLYKWANGDVYEGGFRSGKPYRQGKEKGPDGNVRYEGSYENGKRHGQGIYNHRNQEGEIKWVYKGEFRDSVFHGQGKEIRPDGSVLYKGSYENGKRHGYGKEINIDGSIKYEGQWANGIKLQVKLIPKSEAVKTDSMRQEYYETEKEYREIVKTETHLYSSTIQPYLKIKAQKSKTLKPWNSKFLGVPYMPEGHPNLQLLKSNPKIDTKESLYLLAQINFEELPHLEPFPEKGILQFWIAKNNDYGSSLDPNDPSGFKVIYYPDVQYDHLMAHYHALPLSDDNCPFSDTESEYSLSFTKNEMPITFDDYRFDHVITLPSNLDRMDFGIAYTEVHSNENEDFGVHQIGGYPQFAQEDPRLNKHEDKTHMLLQIDSDRINNIFWGDCGTAHFFISESNLKKKNFTDILYRWDCY